MATRRITVTREWQQITDGSTTAVIQFSDPIELCDSQTQPENAAAALNFPAQTLTITPPTQAWIRAAGCGIYNEIPVIVMGI
ncbi:hypothetical protein MSU25_000136 [Salmonella enterica]|uniref:Uncharacterized protein n=2 Tax=Salmonella enterica TaxID=28901 RepID=A0A633DL64_SALER|nr:hypothetical protein [Salmonella enterica]EAS0615868.1 hypothetical protein [Salmonella enterica subsp. enterica serovar Dahomey]EBQ9004701.1 hypothetical protein [Salmonella enterica subsp. enterica serovar Blockley]EBQ9480299.1 hypothetical protein [Salmonella enterica subsp. enterica serovar Kokomlemle]EBV8414124.1 hypothetical protein [Salmonella enterica subsp. enterica serovar Oranienburg]EBW2603574.1 hypothetical protein [Salmonella enterica subsp. enterica serovar Poano]ECD6162053.